MADRVLTSKEQRYVLERLAELCRSGVPLAEGLRAAGNEAKSRSLKLHLSRLASEIESGTRWDEQLSETGTSGLPDHVLGIIRAGLQAGNLGDALDALVDQDRAYRDVKRHLFSSLAYPAFMVVVTLAVVVAALLFIVRPMEDLLVDFGTELPMTTQFWIAIANELPEKLLVFSVVIVALLLAVRLVGGRIGWRRFVAGIPVLGALIHFAGVAQMLRLLQIMVASETPLPAALRLTSSGTTDAHMQFVAQWLADGTEAGASLSELVASTPRLPESIVPILEWGESSGALNEALQNAYEMLEGRIRLQGSLLSVLLGPLLLIFVAITLGLLVLAMFMPMVSLIQNLT